MLALGRINLLKINRRTDNGLYLDGGADGEVLMPNKYVTSEMHMGDTVEVFVYLDGEERPVATTEKPFAFINEFVKLRVVDVTPHGAFLDWGVVKQLFLPYGEMLYKVKISDQVLVYIYVDPLTNRIISSMKLDNFLETSAPDYIEGQIASAIPFQKTVLGFKCVVDFSYLGLIYQNEIFQAIRLGESYQVQVKKQRTDGKLDLSLQALGHTKLDDLSTKLLSMLKENPSARLLHDQSPPELIYEITSMSKKNFKKALGILFKQKLIDIRGGQTTVK
jgi:uncharacterized protein